MSEETVVAAPSSAEVTDAFNGENVSLADFSHFRATGELPERFKPAGSGEAATPEVEATEEPEPEGEPEETKKPQESRRKPDAEQRIKQLNDEAKRLKAELDALKAPKTEAKPQTQPNTKPSPEDKIADGTPRFKTYEDYVEALSEWKADQRWESHKREQAQQAQQKELDSKVSAAKQRYGDSVDDILIPTVNRIVDDKALSPAVKQMLNESDILPDLLFTLGSDEKEFASFLQKAKTNPGWALRYVALMESGIREELASGGEKDRDDKGQFTSKESPVKPKTGAPKPPSPVGGGSSGAFDVSDESLSAEEWARKRNAEVTKKRNR